MRESIPGLDILGMNLTKLRVFYMEKSDVWDIESELETEGADKLGVECEVEAESSELMLKIASVKEQSRLQDGCKADHLSVIKNAIEMLKRGDIGAPFESEVLASFAALKDADLPASIRLRGEFKAANRKFSTVDFNASIRKLEKSGRDVFQSHHGYAKDALNHFSVCEHQPVAVGGTLYFPEDISNLWREGSVSEIEVVVAERHDGKENCFRQDDYANSAKHAISLASNEGFFADAPVGIACKKSFYTVVDDLIEKEVLSLHHRQIESLNFEPLEMPIPLFEDFLHQTFKSDIEGEESHQTRLIQEFCGGVMLGIIPRYQKAFLWMDRHGRAGKGALESIVQHLVPINSVSAVSPVNWNKEYYIATLCGKKLNSVGEMPEDLYIPSADFKSVLGGDKLTGRSPAKCPVTFRNTAAHLFMSNHMVNTRDQTEAFYARWVMVEFPNSRLKLGLPLDSSLPDRIIKAEMAGIAYWSLEGARRLLKQGRFSESKVHDRLLSEWRRSSNSVEEFIHEECVLDASVFIVNTEFYSAYRNWCVDNGRKPFAKPKVVDMLTHNLKMGIRMGSRQGYKVIRGISLDDKAKKKSANIYLSCGIEGPNSVGSQSAVGVPDF